MVAQEYGMKLNQSKTELLTHPKSDHTALTYSDGSAVPTTTQGKYLGSRISWTNPLHTAFNHRLGLTEEASKKLRFVWNSSLRRSLKYASTTLPLYPYFFMGGCQNYGPFLGS